MKGYKVLQKGTRMSTRHLTLAGLLHILGYIGLAGRNKSQSIKKEGMQVYLAH